MTGRPTAIELAEVQQFFRLPSPQLVDKDWQVVQAMRTLLSVDAAPFRLVFAGGTCLARAHRLVERMSEDVDFKIVPPAATMSKNQRRQALGRLRGRVVEQLTSAGFTLAQAPSSCDANEYTVLHLRTDDGAGPDGPLRPTIQIELSYAGLREPTIQRPVASFVSQAYGRTPELEAVECVSATETAAEKAVSLTRRTAMEINGESRSPDPTLVRHIYDLHLVREQMHTDQVATVMRAVAVMDAEQFGHQHPAYREDIAGETRKALAT
ncbi:MAG: nucleotidyl transferase AbiEii/AbiGii toxin family protein [Rubrivivax sp.]|nr:nucleotidyl transferase AbiEii/AbiGii toxin family protein [Rubrivivax sp.]